MVSSLRTRRVWLDVVEEWTMGAGAERVTAGSAARGGRWARARCWLAAVRQRARHAGEAGMSTAEYAVGTLAAVSFAVTLIAIVRSDAVRSALTSLITDALSSAG